MAGKRKIKPSGIVIGGVVFLLVLLAVINAIRAGGMHDLHVAPVSTASADAEYPLTVYFLDVGEGDGIVIRCGETVLVIDGGEREESDTVNALLKSLGTNTVDCYIATHPHSDHIGAAAGIFGSMNVKSVLLPAFSELNVPTTNTYEKLLTAIQNQGCDVIYAEAGASHTFGDLKLQIFAPVEETGVYNNMSVVFRLEYGKTSFLFTGDAEKESEELMLAQGYDLHADVLKVGHHGSSSSTTPAFLEAVRPRLAVISCGKNNDYGHPHKELLTLLSDAGVPYRRTDLNGTVVVYSDGKDVFVQE